MKYFFYCCIFLSVGLTACKTAQNNNNSNGNNGEDPAPTKTAIIPYDIGNYWVYKYVFHLNENSAKPDTLKVLRHEQTAEGLKVDLNTQKWMVKAKGDSIFVRCQGRGGGEFVQPLYHRTEKSSEFSTCKGDVIMRARVEKLAEPMEVNGKSYEKVYRFELTPQEIFYLADGIGVIKWEYYNVQNKLMTERILMEYKFK
jgi:hypothetical protein